VFGPACRVGLYSILVTPLTFGLPGWDEGDLVAGHLRHMRRKMLVLAGQF
jgi:hypothetical protein